MWNKYITNVIWKLWTYIQIYHIICIQLPRVSFMYWYCCVYFVSQAKLYINNLLYNRVSSEIGGINVWLMYNSLAPCNIRTRSYTTAYIGEMYTCVHLYTFIMNMSVYWAIIDFDYWFFSHIPRALLWSNWQTTENIQRGIPFKLSEFFSNNMLCFAVTGIFTVLMWTL